MLKQLCWLPMAGSNGEKVLHLRTQPGEPWRPYMICPEYKVPDYKVPGGSKGWATYQKLSQAGWTLVPTAQAQHVSPLLERRKSA